MAFYLIRYSRVDDKAYVYPESLAGVWWKLLVYDYRDQVMVGETDAMVEADGKQITSLAPAEAQKLIEEYHANYPKTENRSADLPSAEL